MNSGGGQTHIVRSCFFGHLHPFSKSSPVRMLASPLRHCIVTNRALPSGEFFIWMTTFYS